MSPNINGKVVAWIGIASIVHYALAYWVITAKPHDELVSWVGVVYAAAVCVVNSFASPTITQSAKADNASWNPMGWPLLLGAVWFTGFGYVIYDRRKTNEFTTQACD